MSENKLLTLISSYDQIEIQTLSIFDIVHSYLNMYSIVIIVLIQLNIITILLQDANIINHYYYLQPYESHSRLVENINSLKRTFLK